jgi:hypothetical protein
MIAMIAIVSATRLSNGSFASGFPARQPWEGSSEKERSAATTKAVL